MPLFVYDGKLLIDSDKLAANENCCCGGGGSVYCVKLTKHPCPTKPTIKMTVSWTDGALCKDYFGEKFTNGESRYLCPITYIKSQTTNYTGPSTTAWVAREYWKGNNLTLGRSYGVGQLSGYYSLGVGNENRVYLNGEKDRVLFYGSGTSRPVAPTNTSILYSSLGIVTGEPNPTFNDYELTGAFFNSHTSGTTTFTWAKSAGW